MNGLFSASVPRIERRRRDRKGRKKPRQSGGVLIDPVTLKLEACNELRSP
jgi:hypothetical protein